LRLTNLGEGFLLDYIQYTFQAAPAGYVFHASRISSSEHFISRATIRNETYQEDNSAFSFTGEWGHNTSPAFSGGGTTYTNEDRATATLKFKGA
jgi:hypothetical protein